MADTIEMGNDEFILFIRKNHPACATTNPQLGKKAWAWIGERDPSANKLGEGIVCIWGTEGPFVGDTKLPDRATRFEFARALLPDRYEHLHELGSVR